MTEHAAPESPALQRGFVVPERLPSQEAMDFAQSLEPAGFDTAWLTEIVRDPFTRAATILDRTSTLRVGSAVAQWGRSPVTTAMTAGELDELSDGRFVLGVGISTEKISRDFHDIAWDRPARQMADYVRVIKGAWQAHVDAPLTVVSDHFPVTGFSQPYYHRAPKLMMAAVGDGMLRVAARLADGVIFNPASTKRYCRDIALPVLTAAAEKAGRQVDDVERHVTIRCAVNDDRDLARRWARLGICEYGQYPVHQQVYGVNGFADEAAVIAAAMEQGDVEAAVAAVPDAMVDEFSISGTPDEARHQLSAWRGLVHGVSLSSTSFGMSLDDLRDNCAAVRDAFAVSPSTGPGR